MSGLNENRFDEFDKIGESSALYNESTYSDKEYAISQMHDVFFKHRTRMCDLGLEAARKLNNAYSKRKRMLGNFAIPDSVAKHIAINQHGVITNADNSDMIDIYDAMYTFKTKRAVMSYKEHGKLSEDDLRLMSLSIGMYMLDHNPTNKNELQRIKNILDYRPEGNSFFICTRQ